MIKAIASSKASKKPVAARTLLSAYQIAAASASSIASGWNSTLMRLPFNVLAQPPASFRPRNRTNLSGIQLGDAPPNLDAPLLFRRFVDFRVEAVEKRICKLGACSRRKCQRLGKDLSYRLLHTWIVAVSRPSRRSRTSGAEAARTGKRRFDGRATCLPRCGGARQQSPRRFRHLAAGV